MNKPTKLANYGILEKYVKHEADRSRLVIPVVRNMGGQFTYKLSKRENAALDELIASGSILTAISQAGAVYTVAMPERLPEMFEGMQADLEPVTIHFSGDEMIVTLQRYYNVEQFKRLLLFVAKHTSGILTIAPRQCEAGSAGKVTCFTVTFVSASAYAPDTAQYKRIKALATMYAQRITPRPEAANSGKAPILIGDKQIVQASLF